MDDADRAYILWRQSKGQFFNREHKAFRAGYFLGYQRAADDLELLNKSGWGQADEHEEEAGEAAEGDAHPEVGDAQDQESPDAGGQGQGEEGEEVRPGDPEKETQR